MTFSSGSARRWILIAAAAGFMFRAAFGLLYWTGKPLTHDEREYLALARSVTEGRGFTYDAGDYSGTGQQFGRAPAYPAFLALIGAGRTAYGSTPARVKLAQALLGAIMVWLIGVIAMQAAGPRAGVLAAGVAAIYPPLVWIPAYVFSETLYSLIAFGAAHLLQLAVADTDTPARQRSLILALASGALVGVGILTRPVLLFFVPLATLWLIGRRRVSLAVALLAMTLAVVAPWTARNARVYGRFVLVASEGGVTFWTGNHPLARGEGDLAANPELKSAELEFRRAHPGLTAEELEPLYYRDAFAAIAREPGRWLILLAKKAFYTVVPAGPSYTLHSTRYWAASIVSYLVLLPAALVGLVRLWRRDTRPAAVLLLGAAAVLSSLVFFPQERFRIPVIDPVLIVLAAAFADGVLAAAACAPRATAAKASPGGVA
jgi:4-amino-4-deoxy-L-arabinose transferase-like glycosyltransferase